MGKDARPAPADLILQFAEQGLHRFDEVRVGPPHGARVVGLAVEEPALPSCCGTSSSSLSPACPGTCPNTAGCGRVVPASPPTSATVLRTIRMSKSCRTSAAFSCPSTCSSLVLRSSMARLIRPSRRRRRGSRRASGSRGSSAPAARAVPSGRPGSAPSRKELGPLLDLRKHFALICASALTTNSRRSLAALLGGLAADCASPQRDVDCWPRSPTHSRNSGAIGLTGGMSPTM